MRESWKTCYWSCKTAAFNVITSDQEHLTVHFHQIVDIRRIRQGWFQSTLKPSAKRIHVLKHRLEWNHSAYLKCTKFILLWVSHYILIEGQFPLIYISLLTLSCFIQVYVVTVKNRMCGEPLWHPPGLTCCNYQLFWSCCLAAGMGVMMTWRLCFMWTHRHFFEVVFTWTWQTKAWTFHPQAAETSFSKEKQAPLNACKLGCGFSPTVLL